MENNLKKAAVLGNPIGHSLSPVIHNFWMKEHGIDGVYEKIETPVEQLEDTLYRLQREGYAGVNLTIPLKEACWNLFVKRYETRMTGSSYDRLTESAVMAKAINTLAFLPNNSWVGANTDGYGFIKSVEERVSAEQYAWIKEGPTLVLGAGGAARGVLIELVHCGFKNIHIRNRTREKADSMVHSLAQSVETSYQLEGGLLVGSAFDIFVRSSSSEFKKVDMCVNDWHSALPAGTRLLINATSCGLNGINDLSFDLSPLDRESFVCDLVYKPLVTKLLSDAKENKLHTLDGIGMLIWQAEIAFWRFHGERPRPGDEIRRTVLAHIGKK